MMDTSTHINVMINSNSNDDSVDSCVNDENDTEKLLKPRNNFASYSNDNINIRFRSVTSPSIGETLSNNPRRLNTEEIPPGATNFLSTNYESLDYDPCENYLLQDEERKKGYKFIVKKNFARWFIFLLIGICTALIAGFVNISIEELSNLKYGCLKLYVDQCVTTNCLWLPYLLWLALNFAPVLIGAILVSYIEPVAAGSGIPQVKCYLNGVKMPRVVRIKTLVVKTIGVICTVVGGLAGGKEGPMIHSGAVVAAGISQGKSTTFRKDFKVFQYFREDHEKRDFVSGGAASGVSAAFGAPIGGVLFSIEEGTSFFNQSLTWRTFFASMITTFTLNIILIAALSATLGFSMIYFLNDCKPLGRDPTKFPIQMYCKEGEYSAVAALWFQTPESSVRSLFHDPKGSHNDITLAIFVVLYFFLAVATFGLSMSSGLFIPSLLIGSAWGRLIGSGLAKVFPNCVVLDPGKYALLGAAAQLGGVVRMTISLTVILIEATQGISFGLPLIVVLIMAKWVGDFFNEGIYDIHTQMAGIPILPWEAPPLSNNIYASEIMSHPIVTLKTVENVGHIVELLKCVTFNGFPVVDPPNSDETEIRSYGRFRGLILRSQLIVLLQNKIFNGNLEYWEKSLSVKLFRKEYPRYPTIDQVTISEEEKTYMIDLRPFMNPSPYTLQHSATLPRAFRLFRALGLRHLPVVNDTNEVIGIITRKDVARFRIWEHRGRMGLDELLITNKI
ncbi:H(+)/Cl(-) exchange transporter 7 isoform X3 [Bombus pyrosoma]|uniref:H(+)/Cl(-) exchange transporter 7 isoform X3 n=1 Tax=Bombus pyrosoma TaxID=396416 RepID=UPI001CB9B8EC|nr:H(+)/Cl(-) exchange transporter 7 isoform X3 [Bombus pyrosoma]